MLESFTIETFAPRVGETFRLNLDGQSTVDLVLQSVTEVPVSGWRPPDRAAPRPPFSLAFLGPATVVLPQRIYRLDHDDLGAIEIFIVPVARTAEGVTYEAVFN
jgi:hypothetical protein